MSVNAGFGLGPIAGSGSIFLLKNTFLGIGLGLRVRVKVRVRVRVSGVVLTAFEAVLAVCTIPQMIL